MSRRIRFGWGLLGALALVCGLLVGAPGRSEAAGLLKGVRQADAGSSHTCAVRTDGTVWCWGSNDRGQLGDGTTVDRTRPVRVRNLTKAVQVVAGYAHTCALRSNGTVWCWGGNSAGDLGDGTYTDRATPVRVSNLNGAVAVSGGSHHTCATRFSGTLWCWGWNVGGVLGDGTTVWRTTPVRVKGLTGVVQASTDGNAHTCALVSGGTVQCWGYNVSGQVGDGTTTDRYLPVAVQGLPGPVTQVETGLLFSCARRADGSVWCWGQNDFGALGDGSTVDRLVATESLMTNAVSVDGGAAHTCARTKANRVKCWGQNASGQLGNGTTTLSRTAPVAVVALTGVHGITLGEYHSCAVLRDGTMRCWGANDDGRLGNGTTVDSAFPTPVLR
jgi:alpha-tubulin suppressor-like RCC1 family protein